MRRSLELSDNLRHRGGFTLSFRVATPEGGQSQAFASPINAAKFMIEVLRAFSLDGVQGGRGIPPPKTQRPTDPIIRRRRL